VALDKVTNDTFDGITPPLTYTPGKPTQVARSFVASVSGGKWTGMSDNRPGSRSSGSRQKRGKDDSVFRQSRPQSHRNVSGRDRLGGAGRRGLLVLIVEFKQCVSRRYRY
jgi:hypothetical protein